MGFLNRISIYYLIIIFLISLLFLGTLSFGIPAVFAQAVPPILAAIISDTCLRYFKLKKLVISPSAIITGLIIGLVAQFGEVWWKLILIGSLAITVKFLVRMDGGHIFNPAASGLLLGLLFFNSYPSWWGGGNFWVFLIWIPIMLHKMRRWAPIVGFLAPVVIFNGTGVLTSTSLLFFLSVMLIEPKTSPFTIRNGLVYGAVVGIGYLLFSQTIFDPLIPSLLLGNLGARLLGKILV